MATRATELQSVAPAKEYEVVIALLRRAGSLIASVCIWVGATTAVLREFVAYGCGIACTSG
jgi:hypothetical protein